MKKLLLFLLAAVMLGSFAVCTAEEGTSETAAATASIGDVTFSFTNEQAFYDISYMYPDEFELEIKEDDGRIRHLHRYHADGYDPSAVGLVVSRAKGFGTARERLEDISWVHAITDEEINGVTWAVGTGDGLIIYVFAKGDYVYTFSFSSDYPADFDFADFARAFAGEVKTEPNETDGVLRTYTQTAEGTWQCEGYTYQYRLEISGRMPNAEVDSTFVYLSNIPEISFERAYMAAGLSSNLDDYFSPEDAVLVEMR